MQSLSLALLDWQNVPWDKLDNLPDRTVFQTKEWLSFIAEAQTAHPIVAELRLGGIVVGYFSGLVFRRFGVKLLGSSFPGWTTPYIGFNFLESVSKSETLECLIRFAFTTLNCWHVEFSDRSFVSTDADNLNLANSAYSSYETDLTQSEEELFAGMTSACRRCIRKSEKNGIRILPGHDVEFAEDYYSQLRDVFAKQNLVPTYDINRVRLLIDNVPASHLLLLRACDEAGNCIATGIYPGMNRIAYFWGNASLRSAQILRPNEALHWYAMRYWKERGAEIFDWGGGGSYKTKYGVRPSSIPWFRKSRFKILEGLRESAKRLAAFRQRL